ncbi:uncharacterized protein ACNLHF_001543 isoform 1-T1 [Anomaloglossus baeobatrachus]
MHMSTSTEAAGEEAWREAEVQEQQVLEMSSLVLMVKMMLLLLAQIFPSTFFYRILIFWAGKEKKKKREWVESIMERQQTSTERDASCASGGRWLVTLKAPAYLRRGYLYSPCVTSPPETTPANSAPIARRRRVPAVDGAGEGRGVNASGTGGRRLRSSTGLGYHGICSTTG